ncbi:SGNH/GDSL hydrolase family protein [Oryzobacter telluris]|uniref:SGNH/GDSL hydrolase family protein n=1 Tax=Oryzobacter telluris TaxID=3149179 RepID=UPI00370D7613
MSRTALTAAAAVAAVTLVLSGCGGDPEPAPPSVAPTTASSATTEPEPSESASADAPLYVALGDSLAAGYQPGGAELRDSAYPALAANRLAGDGADLRLENLGCSGETTTSLLKGGKCTFDAGSQIAQAEQVLEAAKGNVGLVTIDIGGNDLLRCVRIEAGIDAACVDQGVKTVGTNLPRILQRLTKAAGGDVPVLVIGYYNPWVAAKALDQPIKGIDAAAKAYTRLSTTIEKSAKGAGATFVGLDEAFGTNDTTPTTIGGRTVPENAARVCTLTNLCTARDIHFSDEGAATVARVVAEAASKAGVSG